MRYTIIYTYDDGREFKMRSVNAINIVEAAEITATNLSTRLDQGNIETVVIQPEG